MNIFRARTGKIHNGVKIFKGDLMAKWAVGVILMVITIVFLILGMIYFPWFTTKTEFRQERIEDEDWIDERLGGYGEPARDWDEVEFGLQDYQLKSSEPRYWSGNNSTDSARSKIFNYNDKVEKGGWDGSYDEILESENLGAWKYGGPAQMDVYNTVYLCVLITIILVIVCMVLIPLAGMRKIPPVAAKIMVVVAIIFVIIGPLYFAIGLPDAIGTDADEKGFEVPPEAGGIMGTADERDQETNRIITDTEFAPGLGWWFTVISIFLVIISLGFISSPPPAAPPPLHPPQEYSDGYDEDYPPYDGEPHDRYGGGAGPQGRYGSQDRYGPQDRYGAPPPRSGQPVRRRRPPPPHYRDSY